MDGKRAISMLRSQPATAIAANGYISRGDPLSAPFGGQCTVACAQYRNSSIYEIAITAGGVDWFIPFQQSQALYCDVPTGQPDGTLVVTFPMNGCAIEIRKDASSYQGNRFYHDSDGAHMPPLGNATQKFRKVYHDYAGVDETTHYRALRYFGEVQNALETPNVGGYEHNIYCIKKEVNGKSSRLL